MPEDAKAGKAWRAIIDDSLSKDGLDGMRAAFRTTLDRQSENRSRIAGFEGRRDKAKKLRDLTTGDPSLLARAVERLRANRIKVMGPYGKAEALDAILLELGGERLVVKSKSNVTKEIELTKFLEGKGFSVVETDAGDRIIQIAGSKQAHPTGPAADLTRYDVARIMGRHLGRELDPDPDSLTKVIRADVRGYIDQARVGITGANFVAAEEGAAVILHNEGNAMECARRPWKHIIVTSTDKIVPDLDEAINLAKLQTFYATGKLVTQYINVISGPSMTADIEKKTFYGMHGPEEVVLVLVDNGRSSIEDRTIMGCFNCGSCLLSCPVYDVVGKEFGGPAYLGGRGVCFTASISGLQVAADSGLWLCTNCGLCTEMCPIRQDTPGFMRATRSRAVSQGIAMPAEQSALVKSVRNYHNPWMQPREARSRWSKDMAIGGEGRLLYFAGCSPSLLSPEISRAAVRVLRAGGLDPCYLGKDEVCCGATLLKLGHADLFLQVARENARRIRESGATKIITACPGCFSMLRRYPQYIEGFDVEVEHISQTMARLVEAGALRFEGTGKAVTYHDPCDLGRHGGVYEEPRQVLRAIPGLDLREMDPNREMAICCGSGGGVKTGYPNLAEGIGRKRIAAARRTGAECIVTSCPWCEANLRDAGRASGDRMEIIDLVVLAESLML